MLKFPNEGIIEVKDGGNSTFSNPEDDPYVISQMRVQWKCELHDVMMHNSKRWLPEESGENRLNKNGFTKGFVNLGIEDEVNSD